MDNSGYGVGHELLTVCSAGCSIHQGGCLLLGAHLLKTPGSHKQSHIALTCTMCPTVIIARAIRIQENRNSDNNMESFPRHPSATDETSLINNTECTQCK